MKTCTICGKQLSDEAKFCSGCGNILNELKPELQKEPGLPADNMYSAPNMYEQNAFVPDQKMPQKKVCDFNSSPAGINVVSVIGFILSFLCLATVWITNLSVVVFPVSLIALVFCTIPKAMKYSNPFSKIGFIVALVITIISGIVFGIHLNDIINGTVWY